MRKERVRLTNEAKQAEARELLSGIDAGEVEFAQSEVVNRTVTFLSAEPQALCQVASPAIQLKDGKGEHIVNLPNPNIQQIYPFKRTDEIANIEDFIDEFYALIPVELKCKQN